VKINEISMRSAYEKTPKRERERERKDSSSREREEREETLLKA